MATSNRQRVGGAVAWLAAGLTYLTLEAVAAAAFRPHYSYSRNLISDLGVPGDHSPLAWLMNIAFGVQGALFLVGAVLAAPRRLFLALAATNAVGNVLIAVFHSGTATHALGATLAIVGGNAAILVAPIAGGWHRRVSIALGAFGLLSFALFVVELKTSTGLPRGVTERCSVYSITAWQLLTAAWLLSRRPTL
jgi:hypothetical membrane protein